MKSEKTKSLKGGAKGQEQEMKARGRGSGPRENEKGTRSSITEEQNRQEKKEENKRGKGRCSLSTRK